MKSLKWILLAVVVVVAAAGASGWYAYNMGKQDGRRAGLNERNDFIAARAAGGAAAQGAPGGAAAAPGGAARGGQGAMAGNFTAGQVKSVNGNDLEISTATAVTKVKLTDKTQIEKTVSGTAADIKAGERIVVQGAKAADGALEASVVQLGAGRFGGAGGPGQGGQ